jgi:GT2 family glycosyltransferase
VIVVNNAEAENEIEEARARERVQVVDPGWNTGFARGCNLGAHAASGEVLVFLNPDTVAGEGAIAALADTVSDTAIGVAMARLRLLDRPALLNSSGNILHISGLAWAGGYEQPAESVSDVRDVPYASGAALAIRMTLFRELGGFTDEFFMYQEDLELCWRARLHGLRVVVTPDADVYHDYDYHRNAGKPYLLERNRLIFVLTAFPGRLLLAVAPVLVAGELGLTALSLLQGWIGPKAAGWWWLLRHARWLSCHRRETMRFKRVSSRELARHLTPRLDPKMIELPPGAGVANAIMSAYWRFAQRLV